MSTPPPRRSMVSPGMVGWGLGMVVAFTVIYFSLPKKPLDPDGASSETSGLSRPGAGSLCEKKLLKWIQSVHPERLQFDTDIESRIQELNRYWTSCGPQGEDPIVTNLAPIEATISGDYRDKTLSPSFGRRDIEHIRQSLLLARMAVRISELQTLDLDRAVAAAAEISSLIEPRSVALETDNPLTPFECLLLGSATPRETAWTLAELFRQLHLDSLVLTTDDASVSPLVAVIVDKDVLLFDSQTGLPIPKPGESTRNTAFRNPATLPEALADDGVFRQLDLEGVSFRWTSEMLRGARIELVGSSCTWAPRSAELQFQWPTSESCVIYDGLGPSENAERGLIERVQSAVVSHGYTGERLRVWEFPEQQCQRYDSLGAEEADHMKLLIQVMGGPRTFQEVEDPQTRQWSVVAQRLKRTLQQARVDQLLGNTTEAIGGYLPLLRSHRAAPKNPTLIDGKVREVMDQNRLVADRAIYWMAATQLENDDTSACSGTLRMYGREFPLGQMRELAVMRMSDCLAREDKWSEAAQLLTEFGVGTQTQRRMLLARRYREIADMKSRTPAGEAPATTNDEEPK